MNKKLKELKGQIIVFLFILTVGLALIFLLNNKNIFEKQKDKIIEEKPEEIEIPDQFVNIEEIHFTHMPITYSIDMGKDNYIEYDAIGRPYTVYTVAKEKKLGDIKKAFEIIENSTDELVKFKEVNLSEESDIRIFGINPPEFDVILNISKNVTADGVLGVAMLGNDTNLIINSSVYFQPTRLYIDQANWNYGRCVDAEGKVFPHTEIHEILHAMGFGHRIDYIYRVMFPIKLNSCQVKEIDKETISCLKRIYSNGEIEGDCTNLNIYPYENYTEIEFEDFTWQKFPVTYSVFNCNSIQLNRLKLAEKQFEEFYKFDFLIYQENKTSQINLYCDTTKEIDAYEIESEYWYDFKLALRRQYLFDNGRIVQANITLFYHTLCDASDTRATQFEMVPLYRAFGVRNDYGNDMEFFCPSQGVAFSSLTKARMKELYPFLP